MRLARTLVLTAAMLMPGAVLVDNAALAGGLFVAQEQEDDTEKKSKRKQRKENRKGARKGAAAGAIVGLALGAVAGEAAAGAAVGAAIGGASGMMYDYDQSRQDDRTQMMSGAIAQSRSGDVAPTETVGDVGKRHMQEFLGEWKVEMWGLDENGERITAKGLVSGVSAGENATRILYREIHVDGFDEPLGGGYMLLTYDPGQGFFVENHFSVTDETLKFVGEYLADKNAYNYYLIDNEGAMTGGILRSSVRLELRISTPSLWVAEAFTHIDGEEVLVQSYRFMKQ